jgi:competence protein ComEC
MGKGGVRATARGEIVVFFREENARRLKEFGRGTEVFAEGDLRVNNAGSSGFNSLGTHTFTAPALHITKPASSLERFRTGLRLGFTRRFTDSSQGGTWAGLALALLLGIRDNLDTGLAALYRSAGCSHILALSGMHLAIIVSLISFLLKKPLGLRLSVIAGAVIIIAYCFIVGPLPSLNRAALMYLLGVAAVLGMLKRDMLSVLCMAFLIQLALTPAAGVSLSFVLSYTALAGLLVIGKAINSVFMGRIPAFLLRSLSASLGAFIATAGVSAWFFTELRPVGILAWLILAPLATVFMALSIAWLSLDPIIPPLSFLLGKVLSLLYWLMEKTAALAAAAPGIRANPFLVILLSLLITITILWLEKRRRIIAGRPEPFA